MGRPMKRDYPPNAIDRARDGALEWLRENTDGYPRSWEQEDLLTARRGYEMYDDFEAPPIAGYEALERERMASRLELVGNRERGDERVHFRFNR